MMKKSKPPALYDPLIIPRVKQYLEENVHQTYVDVSVMAKELQERYREYSRRKTVPFRILVEQAYKTVLHSYGLDSNPSTDNDGECNSDLELMDEETPDSNHMSDTLTSMYMSSKGKSSQNDGGELIDISSDESGDDENLTPQEKANNYKIRGITITKVKPPSNVHQANPQSHSNSYQSGMPTKTPAPGEALPSLRKQYNAPPQSTLPHNTPQQMPLHLNSNLNSNQSQNCVSSNQISKKRKLEVEKNLIENSNSSSGGTVKPLKRVKNHVPITLVRTTFENVGGMEKILKELCELLLHVKHPYIYKHIGLPPPRGFLLYGPPGSGKTLLAEAISGQLKVPLIRITATELIAGVSGESEERIRDLFTIAAGAAPCVLFIDEVDAISSNRMNASKDMERRIVTQLISCLDGLSKEEKGDQVLVIGATNRPDAIDPALRRVGRFDQEISLGIPDREAREDILRIICQHLKLERPFDFEKLATLTPGFVGADLLALATRAASTAVKRIFSQKEENFVKNKISKHGSLNNNEIANVVNLTDDSILMEIDDDVETTKKTDSEIPIPIPDTKEADMEIEKDVTRITDPEKKIDSTESSTIPTTASIIPNSIPTTTSAEISNTTTTTKDSTIDLNIIEKTTEKIDITENTSSAGDLNESINVDDDKVEEINLTGDKSPEPEKTLQINEDSRLLKADADVQDVSVIDEPNCDDVEEIIEESLEEAVLKLPGKKLQLTLNEMISWLTEKRPIINNKDLKNLSISLDDFIEALKHVQPSAKREGFITVPDVTWDDIGSLRDIREELKLAILAPVKFPQKLKILGLNAPSGVLLCGPPGCGKTLLAKAIANEAGINFISVKGPELLNMYVGESERAVRQCFMRARNSAPCVIFFDEFDSLCPKRSDVGDGGAGSRVVNQLLTEMDGVEDRKGVFLMAATNRPDMVDPAVLRPGRLDKILYIGLPNESDRVDILRALTKNGTKPMLATDVDIAELGGLTNGYTGADLAGLVRQASLHALKDSITPDAVASTIDDNEMKVHKVHFTRSLDQTKPSVSDDDKKHYEKLRMKYAAPNQIKGLNF